MMERSNLGMGKPARQEALGNEEAVQTGLVSTLGEGGGRPSHSPLPKGLMACVRK